MKAIERLISLGIKTTTGLDWRSFSDLLEGRTKQNNKKLCVLRNIISSQFLSIFGLTSSFVRRSLFIFHIHFIVLGNLWKCNHRKMKMLKGNRHRDRDRGRERERNQNWNDVFTYIKSTKRVFNSIHRCQFDAMSLYCMPLELISRQITINLFLSILCVTVCYKCLDV